VTPRIAPIGADEWTDEHQSLWNVLSRHPVARQQTDASRGAPGHMVGTFVRHPGLFRAWAAFTTELRLQSVLPARDRELIVLRTGWRCQAPYEWGQHVRMALDLGLTHEEIERVIAGPDAGWDDHDAAVLRSVDDLHDTATIADDTWEQLARDYTPQQLIELPMVSGWYHLIAYAQNALAIAPEMGAGGLEAR
jgi:4-carboxymuconolactone decarboxylase